jgi:hypothetical protein
MNTAINTSGNTADNSSILIDAPAKLTLSLRISGVREDGFHLIDAEMVTLDLVDKVHITPDEDGLSFDGPFSSGISTESDNLVSRALALCGRRARVHIEKNIPSGGGLGGGGSRGEGVHVGAFLEDDEVVAHRLFRHGANVFEGDFEHFARFGLDGGEVEFHIITGGDFDGARSRSGREGDTLTEAREQESREGNQEEVASFHNVTTVGDPFATGKLEGR